MDKENTCPPHTFYTSTFFKDMIRDGDMWQAHRQLHLLLLEPLPPGPAEANSCPEGPQWHTFGMTLG